MLNNFIYAQSKAMFEERLHEVPNDAIVFIEDTKEIWTHGHYFGCLEDLATKQDILISGTNIKTINGESILGSGDIEIISSGGGNIDPELLEGYIPLLREFSDDFNNDFTR